MDEWCLIYHESEAPRQPSVFHVCVAFKILNMSVVYVFSLCHLCFLVSVICLVLFFLNVSHLVLRCRCCPPVSSMYGYFSLLTSLSTLCSMKHTWFGGQVGGSGSFGRLQTQWKESWRQDPRPRSSVLQCISEYSRQT